MKKGSLAAKLASVMKVHRSEMALREHRVAAGDEEEEELYLMVAEVVKRDAFMTELRDCVYSTCWHEFLLENSLTKLQYFKAPFSNENSLTKAQL